jgi:nucleosome binding factor SPN SPT16 subunit
VEKIKDWLDRSNIIFYDIQKNIAWTKFLSTIRHDFKKFVDDGGWTAWDSDS